MKHVIFIQTIYNERLKNLSLFSNVSKRYKDYPNLKDNGKYWGSRENGGCQNQTSTPYYLYVANYNYFQGHIFYCPGEDAIINLWIFCVFFDLFKFIMNRDILMVCSYGIGRYMCCTAYLIIFLSILILLPHTMNVLLYFNYKAK